MSNRLIFMVLTDGIGLERGSIGAWIRNIDAEDGD